VPPPKVRPARITCKNSCAEAFSAILESATRQILVNRQAVLETDDPDGGSSTAHRSAASAQRSAREHQLVLPLLSLATASIDAMIPEIMTPTSGGMARSRRRRSCQQPADHGKAHLRPPLMDSRTSFACHATHSVFVERV
jgi:hypothetical protein